MNAKINPHAVSFKEDIGGYFRQSPAYPFWHYNGQLSEAGKAHYDTLLGRFKSTIDTVVVKAGTDIITHEDPRRRIYNMQCIAEDLTRLRNGELYGRRLNVLLVSSGAIKLGRMARERIGEIIPDEESSSPKQRQIDAVRGQFPLYLLWEGLFYPQVVREKLVVHDDIKLEDRRKGLLEQYRQWLLQGIIPVINEDDARSIEEIDIQLNGERFFRDNDDLARLHAEFLNEAGYRPLLIILTNTDGIYTRESVENKTFQPIRFVKDSTGLEEQAAEIPLDEDSGRLNGGSGGVVSKIMAARAAAAEGIPVIVANGQLCDHDADFQNGVSGAQRKYNVIDAILEGKVVGTRFMPAWS